MKRNNFEEKLPKLLNNFGPTTYNGMNNIQIFSLPVQEND